MSPTRRWHQSMHMHARVTDVKLLPHGRGAMTKHVVKCSGVWVCVCSPLCVLLRPVVLLAAPAAGLMWATGGQPGHLQVTPSCIHQMRQPQLHPCTLHQSSTHTQPALQILQELLQAMHVEQLLPGVIAPCWTFHLCLQYAQSFFLHKSSAHQPKQLTPTACSLLSASPAVPCLQTPVLILTINQQPNTLLAQLNHHNLGPAALVATAILLNSQHARDSFLHATSTT